MILDVGLDDLVVDLEDAARQDLEEALPVHVDIPEVAECDVHGVEVGEALYGD